MSEIDAGHVVRRGARFLGNADHLIGRHEEELRVLVDETRNQPGAGNAVDDRTFASNPFHGAILSSLTIRGTVRAPIACQAAMPPESALASIPRRRSSATASP